MGLAALQSFFICSPFLWCTVVLLFENKGSREASLLGFLFGTVIATLLTIYMYGKFMRGFNGNITLPLFLPNWAGPVVLAFYKIGKTIERRS